MVWTACERFGIRPPGLESKWEDNNEWNQSLLLAYDQVRRIEDSESQTNILKAFIGSKK